MAYIVREAKMLDAEAICVLNREELGYDYPAEQTREKLKQTLLREREVVFVAEQDGEVIGYIHACGYDVLYAPHVKDIMGIAVSSEFRRRGVGAALLGAVEKWAKQTGASGIRLVSGSSRTGAHAFYRHCGYVAGKEQINFKKMF